MKKSAKKTKKKADQWGFLSGVSAKERKQAVKCLQDSMKLFGPKGEYWIKGEEKGTTEAGDETVETFCVIGALHEADGPGEKVAFAVLGIALDAIDMNDYRRERLEYAADAISGDDFDSEDEFLAAIKAHMYDIDDMKEKAEEDIPSVNDASDTTFTTISKGFKLAIQKLQTVK